MNKEIEEELARNGGAKPDEEVDDNDNIQTVDTSMPTTPALSALYSKLNITKDIPNESLVEKVIWNGKELDVFFPFNVVNALGSEKFDELGLKDANGWFDEQNIEFKQLFVGVWATWIWKEASIKDSETALELNWQKMKSYLWDFMKAGLKLNTKDLTNKISKVGTIAEVKTIVENKLEESATEIDVLKLFLYVESLATKQMGKNHLINLEDLTEEHYYSISLENNGLELWGSILFGKFTKDQVKEITLSKFEELKEKFPNFAEVVDYYAGAFYLYHKTGVTPSPVLMLGDPGLGKTYFAQELSKMLNSVSVLLPVSSLSAGWILSGSAPQWKDAEMGKIARNLLVGKTKNPVFVLDEIDKKNQSNYDPLGSLYSLLEMKTAKVFVDEFFGFPLDASGIIWVATANRLDSIPEPILDRFVQFEIRRLTEEETKNVIESVWEELTTGLAVKDLNEDVVNELKVKSPRQIRQILKLGLATAARKHDENFELTTEYIKPTQVNKRYGFGS